MPETAPTLDLNQEIDRLDSLAQEWIELFPQAAPQAERWRTVLSQVRTHLAEDIIRVAVVGTVKSGKSTLINALVGRDLLKRGAGILTAMITRVRPDRQLKAVLAFKSWSEIDEEIHRALGLLPNDRLVQHAAPLSIKHQADRELLAQILIKGQEDELWSKGRLSQNYYLLKSYLEGYDRLRDYLDYGRDLALTGPDLARHQEMVTEESRAVYLKDALLTVPVPWLPDGVELGDCQGSDSPIPQHLAQVLAYLLKTDLVLYVISSRIGLRRADFQFLGELKRMGLGEHLFFILNVDLTEHQGMAEIEQLRERVREELSPWIEAPRLAAFSALKILLERRQSQGEVLEDKEKALLSVWAADQETVAFIESGFAKFAEDLQNELRRLKKERVLGGSLSQVHMVARGLREQLELAQGLLRKDLGGFKELADRLKARRQPLEGAKNTLKQALAGTGERLKKTLKGRVSSYLDLHLGKGESLPQFIWNYQPDWDQLVPPEGSVPPLKAVLYRLFQDFQEELRRFAAGEFNLQVLEFIRRQEEWVQEELQKTISPLFVSLKEALSLYYHEMEDLGFPAAPPRVNFQVPGFSKNIDVPLLSLPLELDWRWTGDVWMRSGTGALRKAWHALKSKLGWKVEADPRAQLIRDLEKALKTIKSFLTEQVRVQLIDYGERLKFQYFFRLIDDLIAKQEENVEALIGSLTSDLEGLADAVRQVEVDRGARQSRLQELAPQVRSLEERLAAAAGRAG
ncbi:MAG: dynamin family protein [Deltaproteobacteria bacterium]|nr:dynamin family protein [Deltaproteobacteria bacterium]